MDWTHLTAKAVVFSFPSYSYKTEVKFDVPLPNFILKRIATVLAKKEQNAIADNLRKDVEDFDE